MDHSGICIRVNLPSCYAFSSNRINLESDSEADQLPANSEKLKVPSMRTVSPDFACDNECISELGNVAVAKFLRF
jgi:hypothetical protein